MEGTPKAIEPKGIVRNATKIGVQDGQAEDLINLRFMDGSWRASGNGRQIENMPTGTIYEQLYVHTNIYHHLLGVDNGTLYWFAEIDNDGVKFYPLDGTSDRSLWPEDKQDLPTEPVALTTVTGSMWITQTGHLLTIIDEADDFEHFVFKTGDKEYKNIDMDINGKQTDRGLFPFGQVHFNWYSGTDSEYIHNFSTTDVDIVADSNNKPNKDSIKLLNDYITTEIAKHVKKNHFFGSVLVLSALRLYDGSFLYTTPPVLISPFDKINFQDGVVSVGDYSDNWAINNESKSGYIPLYYDLGWWTNDPTERDVHDLFFIKHNTTSKITQGDPNIAEIVHDTNIVCSKMDYAPSLIVTNYDHYVGVKSRGYDLTATIENSAIIQKNPDVFKSVCVFVTNPINIYDLEDTDGVQYAKFIEQQDEYQPEGSIRVYLPAKISKDKLTHQLLHSPFFLLREYTSVNELETNPIVDLSAAYEGLLEHDNLVQQDRLTTEALARTTYLPKVSYMYNGRLHIANYKSHPFFGYPIDLFHLHNHSVKVQADSWFKGVLPNLADNNDEYTQYAKDYLDFTEESVLVNNREALIAAGAPYFIIKVYIDASNGEQVVSRYIPAYNPATEPDHTVNFIEALNPFLSYPDARATKMEIYYFYNKTTDIDSNTLWVYNYAAFELKPHPYLNIAYYIKPDLKPISIWHDLNRDSKKFTNPTAADMREFVKILNAEEYFPNGLKVSKTDQQMFFPVEKTYQVGSAEILAIMSSTIPLGTGQTGSAPLVVFCKDGVYALLMGNIVPDTEKVTESILYASAVPISRDVCNNPRSVTPVDGGIVFSTDRGLMMATYDGKNFQIQEIGAPAEGDVVQFWNAGSVDYSKIAKASMQQIAGLPSELCSTTDFLTYLQDKGTSGKAAIINYNHNMRELMVSNPNYPYSYVLDREGNWSRRDYTAAQYVNNYPTSYRVDADGHFYKVDDEGDANTSLEHRKEADNKIFYLSNVIKLDSIGFKQAYRFVVRGYFETLEGANIACVVEGSYDGRKFKPLGYNRKSGKFRDIGCIVERTDVRFFRVILAGQVTGKTRIDYMEMSAGASMLNTKIR